MLSLIFLIIFPFAAWRAWKNIQMAKASTAWPVTTGKIVAAESTKVMFRRQPRVTYSYSVNGAPYTSQRISFAGGYRPKETDAILGRYPVGGEIPVAYAPDKPAEATLETGATKQVMAQLRVLVIFFVLIIAMNILNYYLKSLNKETRQPIHTYGLVELPLPRFLNPVNPANYSALPRRISDCGPVCEGPRTFFEGRPGSRCS